MSGGRIHWSFWGHCLLEKNREPGAESEGLDARLASPQAGICPLCTTRLCNAGCVKDSLFQDFQPGLAMWGGEVHLPPPKTPWQQHEECSVSHPRPIPATSSHQLTQQITLLKFRSESNSCLELVSSPPSRSSVYPVSQATLTSLPTVATAGISTPRPESSKVPLKPHADCCSLRRRPSGGFLLDAKPLTTSVHIFTIPCKSLTIYTFKIWFYCRSQKQRWEYKLGFYVGDCASEYKYGRRRKCRR